MLRAFVIYLIVFSFAHYSGADGMANTEVANELESMELDPTEFDPFAPDVEETLREFDEAVLEQTGESTLIHERSVFDGTGCYRRSCKVWVFVSKSEQRLYLYLDGVQASSWLVSTGVPGRETPNLDRHPDGRIYDRYDSKKWPGGDYKGLGNMPYAVFIVGGIALHGTPKANWRKLGKKASHGCIRQHPDNAKYLNRLVRKAGIKNVWITIR